MKNIKIQIVSNLTRKYRPCKVDRRKVHRNRKSAHF